MSFYKTKIRTSDVWFSKYIRQRDNWTCQFCGRRRHNEEDSQKFHCAHIFSRRFESVRFYEDNAMCLCNRCHQIFTDAEVDNEGEPKYPHWTHFAKEKLGEKRWALLVIKRNTPQKQMSKKLYDKFMGKYFKVAYEDLLKKGV